MQVLQGMSVNFFTQIRAPPFSTVVTATPEGTDSAVESDLSERGQLEPGGAALGVTEGGQTARNRDASLCTYCGRGLEDSTGASAVDSLGMHLVPPRRASAR